MSVYHKPTKRKPSGGKKRPTMKHKKKCHIGRPPTYTEIAPYDERKVIRTKGGGVKVRLYKVAYANVLIKSQNTYKKAKVLRVVENKANREFKRRNIICKGAIIETEIGNAIVTSRPGQDGVINAILIEKGDEK
ncbi:MAG: 30S ribosomal protein S8e [Crenarchaeota archaeon]|nr:30S ribosomal protein S8e [Thermoproteota archaeon]MCR8453426.1 30S ribosomal protein S8e [Thermoproteota archaeon]MCR8454929.1 30S ribosomal protein S8e [Thermoproteota archaeon]MCR8463158.1 30S ribosomal protein S8e [Thermoproteota archaeon]MCR8470490.1 30S ribosomal protein S8e [Thermoproteota archaeon]